MALAFSAFLNVDWSPPVAAPPTTAVEGRAVDRALTYTAPVVDEATGFVEVQVPIAAEVARHVDRIVFDGTDVTWFRRNVWPQQTPQFTLMEPLLYGDGSGVIENVHMAEPLPSWLYLGAPVRVQRRDSEGDLVATDYRGFVSHIERGESSVSYQLAGQAAGRAALQHEPPKIVRVRKELGAIWSVLMDRLRIPFAPATGPETGIKSIARGNTDRLTALTELIGEAQKRNGERWTSMPDEAGVYRMFVKDTETIDATVYFTSGASFSTTLAERPNRIYAEGTTRDGKVINGAVAPGMNPDRYVPDFPGTLEEGDSGEGVRLLGLALKQYGYLGREEWLDGEATDFDADMTDAVRELQDDAGLTVTGVVNNATWKAAFDIDVTGYDLSGARIMPLIQSDEVRVDDRSASGAVIGHNPLHVPGTIPVDRSINVGLIEGRRQLKKMARGVFREARDEQWVGDWSTGDSSTPALALVRGEHTPGDAVAEVDVMPAREVRPGMNVWAPLFEGGTLFHVVGVEVSDNGMAVRLSLDTAARDALEVWEIMAARRESRGNLVRAYVDERRRAPSSRDTTSPWVDWMGRINDTVLIPGWNVIQVPAGQAGTIAAIRLHVEGPWIEYATLVTIREVTQADLNERIPDPLAAVAEGDEFWWEERAEWLEGRLWLYASGTYDEPCGYWPHRKSGVLTGDHRDHGSWPFATKFEAPVLYLSIFNPTDAPAWLRGGQALEANVELGL